MFKHTRNDFFLSSWSSFCSDSTRTGGNPLGLTGDVLIMVPPYLSRVLLVLHLDLYAIEAVEILPVKLHRKSTCFLFTFVYGTSPKVTELIYYFKHFVHLFLLPIAFRFLRRLIGLKIFLFLKAFLFGCEHCQLLILNNDDLQNFCSISISFRASFPLQAFKICFWRNAII